MNNKNMEEGAVFGLLTTTGESKLIPQRHAPYQNNRHFECVCSCDGRKIWVVGANLRRGVTKSCGCERRSAQVERHKNNRIPGIPPVGTIFGNLSVVSVSSPYGGKSTVLCECKCSSRVDVEISALKAGKRTSCGKWECRVNILPEEEASSKHLFASYRRTAATRSLPFELSRPEFTDLVQGDCFYCGTAGENVYTGKRKVIPNRVFRYNGVDRKDSRLGYTTENCVSCCGTCNTCKMDLPLDVFIQRAHQIAKKHPLPSEEK